MFSEKGKANALYAVVLPGQIKHETGLAMDVPSRSVNLELSEEFGETEEENWVKVNEHRVGFIIRYRGGNRLQDIQYEPCHLKCVGKEKAAVIYKDK